jgi:RPA family protein
LPVDPVPTVVDNEELGGTAATISAESAELATKSTMRMDTYAAVAEELRRVRAVALAANVIREQRKEARRMRKVSELDIGVLVALSHTRDAKAAEERKRIRLLAELRENRHSLSATLRPVALQLDG